MIDATLVFVNDRAVRIPAGAAAAAAVAACDPALAERLASGAAHLTDGRGIRLEAAAPVFAGAIIRVVVSSRSLPPSEADAHA